MPRYNVSFVSRVWLEVEVTAPDRASAEVKAQTKIEKHMEEGGIEWLDGKNEICGVINISLLKKLPE